VFSDGASVSYLVLVLDVRCQVLVLFVSDVVLMFGVSVSDLVFSV
jgi:hypothetical protein